MLNTLNSFFRVIFMDKASLRFAGGIVVGFAFSIAVILSTVGIMDGFEWSLKLGLKKSMGDLTVFSRDKNFNFEKDVSPLLREVPASKMTPVLESEGFAVVESLSKGIAIKGVDQDSFSKITDLRLHFKPNEIAIGMELARFFKLKVGDELVLALPQENEQTSALPVLERFQIGQIVEHGIYQKDLRFIYMDRRLLQKYLNLEGLSSSIIMSAFVGKEVDYFKNSEVYLNNIKYSVHQAQNLLGPRFYAKAFWEEFSFLLSAVSTEKYMIGMILQLVVVISIFNVLAFVIFINERRARELFLFQALGMSPKKVFNNMMALVIGIWFLACVLSIGFVAFFDFALATFPIFKLPGDVYTLKSIAINLEALDYIIVFIIALFWLFLMSWLGLSRLRKKSVLQGLRREFA